MIKRKEWRTEHFALAVSYGSRPENHGVGLFFLPWTKGVALWLWCFHVRVEFPLPVGVLMREFSAKAAQAGYLPLEWFRDGAFPWAHALDGVQCFLLTGEGVSDGRESGEVSEDRDGDARGHQGCLSS